MRGDATDTAGVVAPPPLIYLAALLLAYVLNRFSPLPGLPTPLRWAAAALLIFAGVLCAGCAFAAMRRARTPVDPYQSSTRLVTDGPFRFTRNPLYLSLSAFYLAAGLALNTNWAWVLFPGVILLITWGVIRREERYLARKFGAEYAAYRDRVRRWL
jgi:protein-S-isoprenylcysteine O-methyltransferase Ste14